MPATIPQPFWGDGSLYGDGDYYTDLQGLPFEYAVEEEVQCHYLSVRVHYTTVASVDNFFNVYSIRARTMANSQKSYEYESIVDKTTPSQRLSVVVRFTPQTNNESDFHLDDIRLVAQRKKHQRKG